MENVNIVRCLEKMEADLSASIAKRERSIKKAPEGALKCYKNGNSYSWYRILFENDDGNIRRKRLFLKKEEYALAEKLAVKGYNEDALKVERKRLKATRLFLKYFDADIPGEKYLEKNAEYCRLAANALKSKGYSNEELQWMNAKRPYEQPYPEKLTVPCALDYNVRSKSEAEYVATFVKYGIVFRYEWPIKYEEYSKPIFPDFTILVPSTGETFICEHLGYMDDEKYVADNAEKIAMYFRHGVFPGDKLVLSYESGNKRFTSLDAEEIVKNEILPKIPRADEGRSKAAHWID